MNISEILKQLEAYTNPYVDIAELRKELENANIVGEDIIDNDERIDICLENDKHVTINVHHFSDGDSLIITNGASGLQTAVDEVDNKAFVYTVIKNVCKQTIEYKAPEKKKLNLEVDMSRGVNVGSQEASTSFVNMTFIPVLDEKEVRENFKKLIKLCREKKITIRGRKNAEEKLALYPQYLADVNKYNDGVKELQEIWNKIVEEGIYSGYSDDERINQAHKKRFALEKLLYGNTPISQYRTIARDIENKLNDIEDDGVNYTMIGF